MREYLDDWGGIFPDAYNNDQVRMHHSSPSLPEVLDPYIRDQRVWKCPSDTGELFLKDGRGFRGRTRPFFMLDPSSYNWAGYGGGIYFGLVISDKPERRMKIPSMFPMVYESRPWHGNYRWDEDLYRSPALYNICYGDGHVSRVTHQIFEMQGRTAWK
jgi:prepilin-type processing-associated H-X9-DG protein